VILQRKNLYEQQADNKRTTVVVLAAFVAFFAFLGLGFDSFTLGFNPIAPADSPGIPLPIATAIALGVSGFTAYRSLDRGDATILASATARPIDDQNPAYRQLINVTDEMAIAAGIPRPRLFVIADTDPNAFATGKDPQHASITVTQGLVERLTRDELQGVIAHEMSHIRNYDIRLMTVVAALIGAVMLLTEFGLRALRLGGGRKRSSSSRGGGAGGAILFVIWLLALVLAPFISQLLAMAVSRQREYLADASGAELTRNPGALADALHKINAAEDPTRSIKKGTGHLCIADPLGRAANEREGFLADLFATHPPIEKRITLLKAMAFQPA
jgi:heat shock protein HtpX